MPKITQREAIVAALTVRGNAVLPSKSRKYVTMSRTALVYASSAPDSDFAALNGKPTKFFVGKAGALRIGTTVSDSFPANDTFRYKLLVEGGYKP